jgi:hypothetical protein
MATYFDSTFDSTLRAEVRRYLTSCENLLTVACSPTLFTEEEREYVQASEALIKINDLTDAEIEAIQGMLCRLAGKVNSGSRVQLEGSKRPSQDNSLRS